mmetsp:Transcript_16524/g.49329  ORF Transcript_16524/g.49329 Transcript_16524/m.49329 type:complete len:339 (-) Transcript_16524:28-1044(-)
MALKQSGNAGIEVALVRVVSVDHASSPHSQSLFHLLGPADHMRVFVHAQEVPCAVQAPKDKTAIPRPDSNVCDCILFSTNVCVLRKLLVEHVELPFSLHGITVDGILQPFGGIKVKMAEPTSHEWCTPHLPHQPTQALGALGGASREQFAIGVFFCEVDQDRTRFKDAGRRRSGVVHHGGDLRIRVEIDEPRSELCSIDFDLPRVVIKLGVHRANLLEHDGHLNAVRRAQTIQLDWVFADAERLLRSRPRGGAVDTSELAAADNRLPHLRRHVLRLLASRRRRARQSAARRARCARRRGQRRSGLGLGHRAERKAKSLAHRAPRTTQARSDCGGRPRL